jgi:hypothetical protein
VVPLEVNMFGLFKTDPKKKLDQEYKSLLEQAMHAQRSGDIRKYSELTEIAETKKKELDLLEGK